MTNREALEVIERLGVDSRGYPKLKEAIDMAIEALNFVSEHHQSNIETYAHDMGVSLEQAERELRVEELSCSEKPNRSDLISRQAAIEAVDVKCLHRGIVKGIQEIIEDLPSAQPEQPERKKGEWIHKPDIYLDEQTWECSECGEPWIFIEGTPSENNANFCPNCGAEMKGEQNEIN